MAPLLVRLSNAFGFGASTSADTGDAPTPGTPYPYNSGGLISDYTDPGTGTHYRSHTWVDQWETGNHQTFVITEPNACPGIDWLVVGGGGGTTGGHGEPGGGGGAGCIKFEKNASISATGTIPINCGRGGYSFAAPSGTNAPLDGSASELTTPLMTNITAPGGGAGGYKNSYGGRPGGSGGGGSAWEGHDKQGTGTGDGAPGPVQANAIGSDTPTNGYGNDGGSGKSGSGNPYSSGGGGGAGAVGVDSDLGQAAAGGVGMQYKMTGPPTGQQAHGTPGPSSGGGYVAGGGGGTCPNPSPGGPNVGGAGGGAAGGYTPWPFDVRGNDGMWATGGGGSGTAGSAWGGRGGSGVIICRYPIPASTAPARTGGQDAVATGGFISYYNNKTIHQFVYSGEFNNTSGSPITAEVVIIGAGGGGGSWQAGGGGAGRYYSNDSMTIGTGPHTVTIGEGGYGAGPGNPTNLRLRGGTGGSTVFNSITMVGGGGGGPYDNSSAPVRAGGDGGSGGGGGSASGGAPGGSKGDASPSDVDASTNSNTPPVGAGNPGGAGNPAADHGGGGGGGSTGAGADGGPPAWGGAGGSGVQLPSTFRNPQSQIGWPGPSSGKHYVAGGGGGAGAGSPYPGGGGGGAPNVPGSNIPPENTPTHSYAGAGYGGTDGEFPGMPGKIGSGSGGGGGGGQTDWGGKGGGGLVLIAYSDPPAQT